MPSVLLTFDAEEFDLPEEMGRPLPVGDQVALAAEGWARAVTLVDELGVPATFFTTVRLAEHLGAALSGLDARHEVASHGWFHTGWEDEHAARSRTRLEALSGRPVLGFRAPRFQPPPAEILSAAGYRYDASLNPTWIPGRYCALRAPRRPFIRDGLVILPSAVSPCLRIPLFWLAFKRLPFPLYLRMALAALRDTGVLTLVFHTWELASLPAGVAPAWLVRPSGPELVGRLRRLLLALRPLARFETCGAIAARAVGGASPDGKVAYP